MLYGLPPREAKRVEGLWCSFSSLAISHSRAPLENFQQESPLSLFRTTTIHEHLYNCGCTSNSLVRVHASIRNKTKQNKKIFNLRLPEVNFSLSLSPSRSLLFYTMAYWRFWGFGEENFVEFRQTKHFSRGVVQQRRSYVDGRANRSHRNSNQLMVSQRFVYAYIASGYKLVDRRKANLKSLCRQTTRAQQNARHGRTIRLILRPFDSLQIPGPTRISRRRTIQTKFYFQ